MGTLWRLRWVNVDMRPLADVQALVQAQLDLVIAQMSHWEPTSLISRFNRAAAGTRMALPPAFDHVLNAGLHWARRSGGAFDPAAGRLVALWGFGPHAASQLPPTPAELAAWQAGPHWTALRPAAASSAEEDPPATITPPRCEAPPEAMPLPHTLATPTPSTPGRQATGADTPLETASGEARAPLTQPGGLWLDLSGIAKGYAVDAVSQALQAHGLDHFLIDIGGELRASGRRPDGRCWRVQLDAGDDTSAPEVIELNHRAVATSGNRWHRHVHGDDQWSHTVDPRSGQASRSALRAVSVLHAECMHADALATALWVLGVDEGLTFAQAEGVAARLVDAQGRVHLSAHWPRPQSGTQ
ncbi:hypothetical protein CCO03_11855 [Comamonas serinivorans]|uniref:FAD:protein FMN transferase n=2 Tax=Comamonas serinivorans TaxID=1082851 RepID=A0A1Y0ETG0_9BURK|nr:hypothetical protein CCO03_11855 [Comamonas serinivorans]